MIAWAFWVVAAVLPKVQFEGTTDELRHIVASTEKVEVKRSKLKKITRDYVDFQKLAQSTLGAEWAKLDKKKQGEFAVVLEDLIEASYLGRMTESATVDIVYGAENVDGDKATLEGTAKVKGADVALKFVFSKAGERWVLDDVEVDEVSLVKNYRSQFTKSIQKSGYAEFVGKLKKKIGELRHPPKTASTASK